VSARPPGSVGRDRARRTAVLDVIASDPERIWTAPEIHDRTIRYGTVDQVRSILRHLCLSGDVAQVSRGGSGVESTFRAAYPLSALEVG
jgi:hypothetical protein